VELLLPFPSAESARSFRHKTADWGLLLVESAARSRQSVARNPWFAVGRAVRPRGEAGHHPATSFVGNGCAIADRVVSASQVASFPTPIFFNSSSN
jgi:hypothetical protein